MATTALRRPAPPSGDSPAIGMIAGHDRDATFLGLQIDSATLDDLASRIAQRLQPSLESAHVRRELLLPREAAYAIGVSHSKFYALMRAGLPAIRVGGQQRIVLAEAVAWLREHGSEWQDDSGERRGERRKAGAGKKAGR